MASSWLSNVFQLTPIFTRIRSLWEGLDHFFENLALEQNTNGGHQYHEGLSAIKFQNLVLDDSCPWETTDIGNGYMAKCMEIPAGPV
jgi:hypothetical protein